MRLRDLPGGRVVDDDTGHEYPSAYAPGRGGGPDLDAIWSVLDRLRPGQLSIEERSQMAGQLAGLLMARHEAVRPVPRSAVAPAAPAPSRAQQRAAEHAHMERVRARQNDVKRRIAATPPPENALVVHTGNGTTHWVTEPPRRRTIVTVTVDGVRPRRLPFPHVAFGMKFINGVWNGQLMVAFADKVLDSPQDMLLMPGLTNLLHPNAAACLGRDFVHDAPPTERFWNSPFTEEAGVFRDSVARMIPEFDYDWWARQDAVAWPKMTTVAEMSQNGAQVVESYVVSSSEPDTWPNRRVRKKKVQFTTRYGAVVAPGINEAAAAPGITAAAAADEVAPAQLVEVDLMFIARRD